MTFGDKQFTGVGYPTPVSIPEATTCFLMQVPASSEWWALVVGVLFTLTLEWNWQQFEGGLDRDVAAARWTTMLDDAMALAAVSNQCSADVGPPYWDNVSDVENESPVIDQAWYGQLVESVSGFSTFDTDPPTLTFKDRIGIWAIAGFIAYAGLPGAAIAFVPVAEKFVLTFKTGDFGAIVNVIIDTLQWATVDTYSATPGMKSTSVVMPSTEGTHTMWVEHSGEHNPDAVPDADGDYLIQVVRKELNSDEVSNPNLRYNADCDCIQQTSDGGTTWVDNPGADPRSAAPFRLPARTDDNAQCKAATGMARYVKAHVDNFLTGVQLAQEVTTALELLLPLLFGGAGVLIDVIIIFLELLADYGTLTIEEAFTSDVYDGLTCIFYCNIDTNGQMSAAQLANAQAQISARYPGTVANVLAQLGVMSGPVILSNAGAEYDGLAMDCSGCDCSWEKVFSFAAGENSWAAVPWYGTGPTGAWNAGAFESVDVGGDHSGIMIEYDLVVPADCVVTQVLCQWADDGSGTGAGLYYDAESNESGSPGNPFSLTVTASSPGTAVIKAAIVNAVYPAKTYILSMTLRGTGVEPTF